MTVLLLPFQFILLLFLFLFWLLCLGLPKLCWIKVMNMDIFVLLLILEKTHSTFHYWVWCWLLACYMAFIMLRYAPSMPIFWRVFNYKLMLNFINSFISPLQYSCLENPMDWGAWWATVHGVAKSWTWLSDLTLFASIEMIIWFLFFILLMWCITLTICIYWKILALLG